MVRRIKAWPLPARVGLFAGVGLLWTLLSTLLLFPGSSVLPGLLVWVAGIVVFVVAEQVAAGRWLARRSPRRGASN